MTNVYNEVKLRLTSDTTKNYHVRLLFDVRDHKMLTTVKAFQILVLKIFYKVLTEQVTRRNVGEHTNWPEHVASPDSRGISDTHYRP